MTVGKLDAGATNPAGETGLRIVRGIIDTSGSGSIVKGSGFTISRNGAGDVTVTFSVAFSDRPALSVTAGETAGANAAKVSSLTAPTASVFRLLHFTANTAAALDGIVHFIAIGPH